jgi:hypothetical protein
MGGQRRDVWEECVGEKRTEKGSMRTKKRGGSLVGPMWPKVARGGPR